MHFLRSGLLIFGLCCSVLPSQADYMNLVTFFDCTENLTTLEEVEGCDIFAYVGAQVARDVFNALPNKTTVQFHPVQVTSNTTSEVRIIQCSC